MKRFFQSHPTLTLCVSTAFAMLLAGCGARSIEATDTKTNWLSQCDADSECGDGLSCLCGVCSARCDDAAACSTLDSRARCFAVSHCGKVEAVCALKESTLFESSATPTPTSNEHPSDSGVSSPAPDGGEVTEPPPACRDEAEYVALGSCAGIDYACQTFERPFADECGCGCEPNPECPDLDYVEMLPNETCAIVDFLCPDDAQTRFENECGCGCEVRTTCDDPNRTYVSTDVAYCQTANVECEDTELEFLNDCGCGCWAPPTLDGGSAPEWCPAPPEGETIASRVLTEKEPCASDDVSSKAVASQEELDAVLAACGVTAISPNFEGNLVYVAISTDRPWASFDSAVATEDGVYLALKTNAYCGGANPPNAIVVVELQGLDGNSNVTTDLCIQGECSGLPVP
jgi:hypothetical protein